MKLADFLCYIILTITVTATCAKPEQQNKELEESQDGKRISKREAAVLIDFNNNVMDKIFQKPKVIYRRISKSKFGHSKTKYGALRPLHDSKNLKNRPRKVTRTPGKKGRSGKKPKYSTPKYQHKKRASKNKPKYSQFRSNSRPGFGHVVKVPHYSFFTPYRAAGFGEPPAKTISEHKPNYNTYAEPPVDSYGAPVRTVIRDVYPTPFSSKESSQYYDNQELKKREQPRIQKYTQYSDDTTYTYTNKDPLDSIFVTPTPKNIHKDSLDPILDKQIMEDNTFFYRKKRPFYFTDSKAMYMNKPWKPSKGNKFDDEVIVGGQYAEPPARYVAKFSKNSPTYLDDDEEDTYPALHGNVDTEIALSSYSSPYSNYKHSNMAFSPQNLNDAFSVPDK